MGVLGNAKIEVFNFRNEKSHVEKFYSFQYFVDFLTDLDSLDLKFFRTGPKFAYRKVASTKASRFVTRLVFKHTLIRNMS